MFLGSWIKIRSYILLTSSTVSCHSLSISSYIDTLGSFFCSTNKRHHSLRTAFWVQQPIVSFSILFAKAFVDLLWWINFTFSILCRHISILDELTYLSGRYGFFINSLNKYERIILDDDLRIISCIAWFRAISYR